jgi:hypothetical protein
MDRCECETVSAMFVAASVILYTGVIMYEQHYLTSMDATVLNDNIDQYCAFWIFLEIAAFYGLLLSAIIYLFTI